jgi:hypothetical protein
MHAGLITQTDIESAQLSPAGQLAPRAARDIAASPISIGFESLDRYHFDPKRTYAHLAALGAKWGRVQTGWNRCERVRGVYEFGWLDEVIDSLLDVGVQPFFTLGFGNRLYTPDAPHESARGYVAAAYGVEADRAWRDYVAALAAHFGGRVRHWEVWNEPNASGFWQPHKPDPAAYVRLLADTVPLLRAGVPDAFVIGGVFASVRPTGTLPFVEECFRHGMGEWIDALSWHPYRAMPEHGLEEEVNVLRRLVAAHAPGVVLWQGECGCQSRRGGLCEFLDMEHLDELVQAKWVLRRILCDLRLGLEFTQYFHTVDLFNYIKHDGPSGMNQYMGLLRGEDYSPKPSFRALQTLCSLFDSETRRWGAMPFFARRQSDRGGRLVNAAAIQTATFRRGDSVVYAYWVPSDFDDPFPGATVRGTFWHGGETPWKAPVLVDPVAQAVYRLPADGVSPAGGAFTLPLLDGPLLIADEHMLRGVGCL